MQQLLPIQIIHHITRLSVNRNERDVAIWTPAQSRNFNCKSAWEVLRKHKPSSLTSSNIWHRKLPFKVTFFMMRMLSNKLPTDDKISRFGINGPFICCCCSQNKSETVQHLFNQSDLDKKVWGYFSDSCGILFIQDNLRHNIMHWCLMDTKTSIHRVLTQCLLTIICWELWKSRCYYLCLIVNSLI